MTTKIPTAMMAVDIATQAELDAEATTRGNADTANAAAAAAAALKQSGDTVQMVSSESGTVATGTTVIPLDNTIPQSTEGDQYLTVSITPASASNTLVIDAVLMLANSAAGGRLMVALFQDATASALAVTSQTFASAGQSQTIRLRHIMAAGTTSATTFKIRAGANNAGTTTLNGEAGAQLFGGAAASSLTVTEIKA